MSQDEKEYETDSGSLDESSNTVHDALLGQNPAAAATSSASQARVARHRWMPKETHLLRLALLTVVTGFIFFVGSIRWQGRSFTDSRTMRQPINPNGIQQAVILASYRKQNTSWLLNLPSNWKPFHYIADIGQEDDLDASDTLGTDLPVAVANQGREAMAYLTFITDHWDSLPPFMAFMHGHDMSGHHQPEHAANLLRALNLRALEQQGYMTMRCSETFICGEGAGRNDMRNGPETREHGRPSFEVSRALPAWWLLLFGEEVQGSIPESLPADFRGPGGGQFAVTAEQVRKRPREFWNQLRTFLEGDSAVLDKKLRDISANTWNIPRKDRADMFAPLQSYHIGMLFEKSWHKVMGKGDLYCPDERECRDDWFSGAIHCTLTFPNAKPDMKAAYRNGNCTVDKVAMAQAEVKNLKYMGSAHLPEENDPVDK